VSARFEDPILLEVYANRLSAIAEEMGVLLQRTAFSPNIRERRDYSCALFGPNGDLVAQAAHIPVHLGSMATAVAAVKQVLELGPGDAAIVNDPYAGGTHLPDVTVVAAAALQEGCPGFFVASRAHHADIGGPRPGSMPLVDHIDKEGVRLPPQLLVRAGRLESGLWRRLLGAVRAPHERAGDFEAQLAACRTGALRLTELVGRDGFEQVQGYAGALQDHAERCLRDLIRRLPDGTYGFEDLLDGDGLGANDLPIRVTLRIQGDTLEVDFAGTAPQTRGPVNAPLAVTTAATLYVLRCLADFPLPVNAGLLRPVRILTLPGSLVHALPPAPVGAGNVETSQRIVDVLLGAFAQALPERIPAASQGTMNNLLIGRGSPQEQGSFAYYETIAGGAGAGPGWDGESGIQIHMTNTRNTPVETLESVYPLRVLEYRLRRGSGGAGRWRGGDGLVRAVQVLEDGLELTLITERRRRGPYGLAGGSPGQPGENTLRHADGSEETLPPKVERTLNAGDTVVIATPGGGGYGKTAAATASTS
jgi:N-methylhydantoinase B